MSILNGTPVHFMERDGEVIRCGGTEYWARLRQGYRPISDADDGERRWKRQQRGEGRNTTPRSDRPMQVRGD